MDISLPPPRYPNPKDVRFFAELGRRVRLLPGVLNASTITFLPFKGQGSGTYFWRGDRSRPAPGQEPVTSVRMVQPQYFETMNIPLRRGRTFDERENDPQAPPRFVISETLARQAFPHEDPIGRSLVVNMKTDNSPGEIIGVVGDIRHGSLDEKDRPMVYYPQAQLSFSFGTFVVHTAAEPLSLAAAVRGVVRQMDPQLPVSEVGTMQRWVDDSLSRTRFQTGLLAIFAALAMLLATLGIYGVMSYGVAQRAHEIGVRLALGAGRGQVARMILSRAIVLTLAGLALGLAGAFVLTRYLETLLFEVKPADPITLASVTGLLLAVALLAALVPAGRATRLSPVDILRCE
jgi:putative ABC transport system permease protein